MYSVFLGIRKKLDLIVGKTAAYENSEKYSELLCYIYKILEIDTKTMLSEWEQKERKT